MSSFNFQNATPDYLERQVRLQCAKHAINHVLQEEKVVKVPPPFAVQGTPVSGKFIDKATGKAAPDNSSAMDPAIQLNLWELCDEFDLLQAIQTGYNTPANFIRNASPQERCDSVHENMPFEGLVFILSELNYKTDFKIDTPTNLAAHVAQAITTPELLGVILNLGGGHYTALSKFLATRSLWNQTDGIVSIEKVAYLESIPDATGQVQVVIQPVASLEGFLRSLRLYGCIYVYASDDAYPSVAMKRFTTLSNRPNAVMGGGRKRRATKRRSHRKRKHTQRRR